MTFQSRSSPGAGSPDQDYTSVEAVNEAFSNYILVISAAIAAAVVLWKVADQLAKYVRLAVCAGNGNQQYFTLPSPTLSWAKRYVLYAPVLSKRHNREFQLSRAVTVGNLPTRFQLLFITAYFLTNVVFCVADITFSSSFDTVARLVRNRTGVMATVNMVPLIVLAGRNNPLISLLGISFDTYNLIHRWFGRIVVLESLAHTLAFLAGSGWSTAFSHIIGSPFLYWGLISVLAFLTTAVLAYGPIRHAFYETFKILHIGFAFVAALGLWYHLHIKGLPQLKYLYTAIAFWGLDRLIRVLRAAYYHVGHAKTHATVEALPGKACRVSVTLARRWPLKSGQHAYLYVPGISLLQSHPFSVAWNEGNDDLGTDRLVSTRQQLRDTKKTRISFIVRARTGFTNTLYQKAKAAPAGKLETKAFVEGPYGVSHPLKSYGTAVLFAGGVGITHQLPYVRELVEGFSQGTMATRRVLLVWTLQNPEHLEWIRPWMTEILSMEKRRDILRIMLFISQPRSSKEICSPSATVQMFPGRPNVDTLLAMEQDQQVGAMVVSVCGPGSFSDEVRLAVRRRQHRSAVDFIEEAFSW